MDWKEIDKQIGEGTVGDINVEHACDVAGASKYAVKQTLWSEDRGKEVDQLAKTAGKQSDEYAAADMFSMCFEPNPEKEENPQDADRAAWIESLSKCPEYHALHSKTCFDVAMSMYGALSLVEQYYACAEKMKSVEDEAEKEIILQSSVKQAATKVEEEIDAVGWFAGRDNSGLHRLHSLEKLSIYRKAMQDDTVKKILMEAGRYWRLCQTLQRRKTTNVRHSQISKIVLSGDVERLVPWELAQVAGVVPRLKLLALYRLSKSQCLSYGSDQVSEVKGGPMIVSIDESGSMAGNKLIAAKAIGLALARLCSEQNRLIVLAAFSGPNEWRWVCIYPKEQPEGLLEFLESSFNGGTHAAGPLHEITCVAMNNWDEEKYGHADHIIITDGAIEGVKDYMDEYKRWATQKKVTTFTIGIGDDCDINTMKLFSDKIYITKLLSLDSEAVASVLSI